MGARIGAIIFLTLLSTPSLAGGVLPFEGAFGNAGGCRFYNHGGTPSEDFMLLTPDTFAAHAAACDFDALISHDQAVFLVSAVCQGAGDGREGMDQLQVIDHGAEGYGIKFEDIAEWGPWTACPPSDVNSGETTVQL
jgi:hypothetical protein